MKHQAQRSMFDDFSQKEIERRLAAFDTEAKAGEDPEDQVTEMREYLEHELKHSATLLPSRASLQGEELQSDYQRIRGLYELRKAQRTEERRLEYPNSPGLKKKILDY